MGINTTPWDQVTVTFVSPSEMPDFEAVLRKYEADTLFVACLDQLTDSNLRLAGATVNVQLTSGRTETKFRSFAAFVQGTAWTRISRTATPVAGSPR